MVQRWAMTNREKGFHIECNYSAMGKLFLEGVRKGWSEQFKGCRIVKIARNNPSDVSIAYIYDRNHDNWNEIVG